MKFGFCLEGSFVNFAQDMAGGIANSPAPKLGLARPRGPSEVHRRVFPFEYQPNKVHHFEKERLSFLHGKGKRNSGGRQQLFFAPFRIQSSLSILPTLGFVSGYDISDASACLTRPPRAVPHLGKSWWLASMNVSFLGSSFPG